MFTQERILISNFHFIKRDSYPIELSFRDNILETKHSKRLTFMLHKLYIYIYKKEKMLSKKHKLCLPSSAKCFFNFFFFLTLIPF
jgi:hypothetical protein